MGAPSNPLLRAGNIPLRATPSSPAPQLATIGGTLGIGSLTLAALDLPSLVSIGKALPPTTNALDLDPWVGGLACFPDNGNPVLATLHLPLLANLGAANDGTFNLGYTPVLPQCSIDALATQLQQAGWTGQVHDAIPSNCQTAAGPCP